MGMNWPEPPRAGMRDGLPPLSPTGALRVRQRIETTQQALSELGVLTEQLIALPERLQQNGVAREQWLALHDALTVFTELAALAWDGLAEDRLDQLATTPRYRQYVTAATRRINRLQQEAATPKTLPTAAAHGGPFWSWRTRVYQQALEQWRGALRRSLGGAPGVFALGTALEALRAATGQTALSGLSLVLQRALVVIAIALGVLTILTALVTGAALYYNNAGGRAALVLGAGALTLAAWSGVLWLLEGEGSLWALAGAVRSRLREREGDAGQAALALWRWVWLPLALAGDLVAVGGAAWLLASDPARWGLAGLGGDFNRAMAALAGKPLDLLLAVTAVTLAAPLVVLLPFSMAYQGALAADLASDAARLPVGRRVALPFALRTLIWHLLPLLAGGLAAARLAGLDGGVLLRYGVGRVSWLAVVALGIILAGYYGLVEIPYRVGNGRWLRARLAVLEAQKREIAARLDRMEASAALLSDVPAVQYDVARLQFLQLQADDAARQSGMPISLRARLLALVLLIVVALLLDNALRLPILP